MGPNDKPIIIIKKKGGHGGGHHGGSWKVAYADFVTAMMAFFLVMWILGLSQDTRKAIAAYFNDPTGMMRTGAGGANPTSDGRQMLKGLPTIMPSHAALLKSKAEREQFKAAKFALEQMLKKKPEFSSFRKYVEIALTREGLRIELLDGEKGLFFESGSAVLKPQTVELLTLMGRELGKLPNSVVLEGHTDAQAYSGGLKGYSNWELSADRANSARRAMEPTLRPDQVSEVRGYADRRLRDPQDPYHFSNRRVSILVPYTGTKDNSPTREVGPDDFSEPAPTVGMNMGGPPAHP